MLQITVTSPWQWKLWGLGLPMKERLILARRGTIMYKWDVSGDGFMSELKDRTLGRTLGSTPSIHGTRRMYRNRIMMISPSASEVTAAVLNMYFRPRRRSCKNQHPIVNKRQCHFLRTVPIRPILFHSTFSKTLHESRGNRWSLRQESRIWAVEVCDGKARLIDRSLRTFYVVIYI